MNDGLDTQQKSMIMGIMNLTPDSFSDGGDHDTVEKAVDGAWQMHADGADVIDLGAESSRPGAKPIPIEEEWQRLEPVLKQLRQENYPLPLSVDTYKPGIMLRAVDLGVTYINNIMGLTDKATLLRLAATKSVSYIAMHMHDKPETMQNQPISGSKILGVLDTYFSEVSSKLSECGFGKSRIYLDPGVGFGKTDQANFKVIEWMLSAANTRNNIVAGISRKSFIGRTLAIQDPKLRDHPGKMLEAALMFAGVRMIRTHDVKGISDIRKVWQLGDQC